MQRRPVVAAKEAEFDLDRVDRLAISPHRLPAPEGYEVTNSTRLQGRQRIADSLRNEKRTVGSDQPLPPGITS
jgi:hypothetical protein